ncbi:hypothetical protein [Conexivisphaera calida]|nr:hypothetical protein [Conexivisphaera calida]
MARSRNRAFIRLNAAHMNMAFTLTLGTAVTNTRVKWKTLLMNA